jgi:hypothetical protein
MLNPYITGFFLINLAPKKCILNLVQLKTFTQPYDTYTKTAPLLNPTRNYRAWVTGVKRPSLYGDM